MSKPSDPENIALEFVQLWAENMAKVMAQIASAPFPLEIASRTGDEAPAAAEADTYHAGLGRSADLVARGQRLVVLWSRREI
jgi:hypothetical protein